MQSPSIEITGQLSAGERQLLTDAIVSAQKKPRHVLEVGTWLGGGSTLHILRALQQNREGHLWGVEADSGIYDQMIQNIRAAVPDAVDRFTPLFGFSHDVIPQLLAEQGPQFQIDLAFLDGGMKPQEQIAELELIKDRIPIGGVLFAHDARMRKGKWLVPYISALDNWQSEVVDLSEVGLLRARKLAAHPSAASDKRARSVLRQLRLQPTELIAAILPRRLGLFLWGLLPRRFTDSFAAGRL